MTQAELDKRFDFHPPATAARVAAHEVTRTVVKKAALRLDAILPESREKSLAFTALEEALMWANAAIARNLEEKA